MRCFQYRLGVRLSSHYYFLQTVFSFFIALGNISWVNNEEKDNGRVIYASTDAKTKVCGDEVYVHDCEDTSSDYLYSITTDSCLSAKTYEGEQQNF